jgi:hypothetical protein
MAIQEDFYNDMFEDRPTVFRSPMERQEELTNLLTAQNKPAEEANSDVINALMQQILASSNTSKWTGQGRGSAEANARDMAKIMADIGITDIKQFGPVTREVQEIVGNDDGGNPIYETQTQRTFGNKETGQAVPLTYSGRQTGNFFGGTFEGKGNTGYGVMFDGEGNPIFYTQGASSNDLANLMQDLGPIGQIGLAVATGGLSIPQQIAANMALQVLSGQDVGNAIKNAAVSLAVAQIPGTDFMKEANKYISGLDLPANITSTLNRSFQNAAMSGTRALLTGQDVSDAMLKGAAAGGTGGAVNALMREIPGFDQLSKDQQRMATNAVIGVVSGRPLDQIVINAAIAAANAEVAEQKKYAPLNDKQLAELDPDELKKYNEGGTKALFDYQATLKNLSALTKSGRTGDDMGGNVDPDVNALQKSGLPSGSPTELVITGNSDYDNFLASIGITNPSKLRDSGLSNQDIEDLIHGRTPVKRDDRVTITAPKTPEVGTTTAPVTDPIFQTPVNPTAPNVGNVLITTKGLPKEPEPPVDPVSLITNPIFQTPVSPTAPNIGPQGTMTITTNRLPKEPEPPIDPVSLITNPIFQTPVSPTAPNIGNQGTMVITTNRLPKEPEPPIDPVSLITDPLTPGTLPPTTPAPSTPAKPPPPAPPRINIDPVQALQQFYNPFKPEQSGRPPSQTDTGPIQLMTDIFGTNIATTQKAAARGYGFSAGGDIDELLRLLRK